jgi:hypothetical protein
MKKLSYEYVKQFIESEEGNGCKLISDTYIDAHTDLLVLCKCGETYRVNFNRFKSNNQRQCPKCGDRKGREKSKNTFEEMIKRFQDEGCSVDIDESLLAWNKKLENNEMTCETEFYIQCKICGDYYKVTWYNFKSNNKKHCNKCGKDILANKTKTRCTQNTFISMKKDIESYNNCKVVSTEEEYNNYKGIPSQYNFKIICGICGKLFIRDYHNFIAKNSQKCKDCCIKERNDSQSFSFDDYIKLFEQEGSKVNREKSLISWNKGLKNKIRPNMRKFYIKCTEENCENYFWVNWNSFSDKNKSQKRCKICSELISKGELEIKNILLKYNINFNTQYTFDNLIGLGGGLLKYDFAILNNNELKCLIEYDGKYHFEPIKYYKNEPVRLAQERLEYRQKHDKLKDKYCIENNILLIRIPYWEFNSIENILKNILIDNNLENIHLINNFKYDSILKYLKNSL